MATLRIGSQGPEVERLQKLLNVKPPDGDFGPRTYDAVRDFQRGQGLVADGAVGPRTWDALEKRSVPSGGGSGGGGGSTPSTPATPAGGSTNPTNPTNPTAPSDTPTAQPGSSITIQQLRAIFTQAPLKKLEAYLPLLNAAMTEAQINTKLRKSAFLAQVAHESAEFIYMKEQGSQAYFTRMYDINGRRPKKARELGNLSPGEGAKYAGRGPIQVTGKTNYRSCGKALGLDLVNHPELVEVPAIAFRASAWYWRHRGINEAADRRDFRRVTKLVNGGYRHYADRVKYYNRALGVL